VVRSWACGRVGHAGARDRVVHGAPGTIALDRSNRGWLVVHHLAEE
jgi:hypothetical protein